MHPPARILVLAPNWLGDAVLALPALGVLRAANVGVDLWTRPQTRRVFVDAIGSGTLRQSAGGRLQHFVHAWRLRAQRYDAAVVLPPSASSACYAWASGARRRIGERHGARGVWLTHALSPIGRDTHLSDAYVRLARTALESLQVDAAAAPPRAEASGLRVHDSERQAARALLASAGVDAHVRPWVVAPGARYGPAKRYPVERFEVAVQRLLAVDPAPVVLVGGARERLTTRALGSRLPDSVDLAGRTDLGTLLGVLDSARGVLSNDSGVMHLAAALGAAVVGIFGSTNPRWTRPVGPRAAWVSNPVPCAPCYRRRCPIDFPCMLGLDAQVVAEKLLAVVHAGPGDVESPATPL